uniref:Uncharacterized protein n=1 Tax=Alexandrium monilatum TaxID=311494 RepID=A0A7S4V2X9_9DINO
MHAAVQAESEHGRIELVPQSASVQVRGEQPGPSPRQPRRKQKQQTYDKKCVKYKDTEKAEGTSATFTKGFANYVGDVGAAARLVVLLATGVVVQVTLGCRQWATEVQEARHARVGYRSALDIAFRRLLDEPRMREDFWTAVYKRRMAKTGIGSRAPR